MNLKEKFYDRLGFKRESTVNSMKSNPELKAGNIVKVAETGYFYDIKSTSTSIPLNNGLFAEVKQTTFLQIVNKCVNDLTNLTNSFNSLKNSFETHVSGSFNNLKKAFETHEIKKVTQSQDGHMSKEDKSKLDNVANNANNYSHPTGTGNNHIPSGGQIGQALINSGNGVASWGSASSPIVKIDKDGTFNIGGGSRTINLTEEAKKYKVLMIKAGGQTNDVLLLNLIPNQWVKTKCGDRGGAGTMHILWDGATTIRVNHYIDRDYREGRCEGVWGLI
ncbi:MAG: hypothetical protein ACRDCE_14085 [Cetobacterium sp.]|uniref:hypothetical protein n=1 Tax=Cetobacterium sp. TaxID=2071632 RepID=UPI003EE45118